MKKKQQNFGGDWSSQKLEIIRKYLSAYTTVLKKTPFETIYIDAFAGSGYMSLKNKPDESEILFPELADSESQKFLKGSARIALETIPSFKKFIFIENDEKQFAELEKLTETFPDKKDKILLKFSEANEFLLEFCSKTNWRKNRAVLFLDPFGMQVTWKTIESVATTKAIDLWYLFPISPVTRLLKRDGHLSQKWEDKLTAIFGDTSWREAFYSENQNIEMFESEPSFIKTASYENIQKYLLKRLEIVFTGVAQNPLKLLNSRSNPLFLLCFACGNKNGKDKALRIANHILKG